MAENLKVRIEAQVANYDKIVQTIKDGIEKGLVDGVSDKALAQLTKRLETVRAQLNVGSFEDAIKSLQRFNVALIRLEENINTAAGAASSELARLTAQLNEAKLRKAEIERRSPENRYRELPSQKGQYVLAKSGVDHAAVGMRDETAWKNGKAVLNGQEINYGGATWSIQSAIRRIVEAINDGGKQLEGDFKKAIEAFGYNVNQFTKENGKYVVPAQPLATTQFKSEMAAWEAAKAKATADVTKAEVEVKEATANVEKITVTAETGSFTSPIPATVALGKEDSRILDDLNKAKTQTIKKNHDLSAANEEARNKQDKLNASIKDGTVALNNQQGAVGRAVATFFGYQMVLRQLRRLWREAIHTITELDKQLTTQAMVTGMTREETWQLVGTYQKLADVTGLAQTTIAGVTTEYLRQGESLENALTLTRAAAAAATVAGISAQDSVKYLTTAIHGFKLDAEDALAVSDKFAALAASAATNYEDLAVALSKVASQAALAGMSMDYTLALLTTGLDVTQEAPESIGTALKTVIARMREISDYGKTLEDNVDLNQVEDGLRAVNIALRDGEGNLRSTEAVLDELGRKWDTLTANQQAAVAKALAGTRQQSRLVAIMENYDKVLENQERSANSIGATTAQQVTYLEGMEAAMNRLTNAYQTLIDKLIKSDEVIGIVNWLTGIIEQVRKFLSTPGGRLALISGLMTALLRSQQFIERIKNTILSLVQGLRQTLGLTKQTTAEMQKQTNILANQQALQKTRHGFLTHTGANGQTYLNAARPNGMWSNRAGESNFMDVLKALIANPGKGWGSMLKNTASSWWHNNSLVAKVAEPFQRRGYNKQLVGQNREDASSYIAAENKLRAARQRVADITAEETAIEEKQAEAMATGDDALDAEARAEETARQARLKAAQQEVELAQQEVNIKRKGFVDQADAERTLAVLSSKRLTMGEKATYLEKQKYLAAKKGELAEKEASGEDTKQLQAEIESTEQDLHQLETKAAGKGKITGSSFSKGVGAVTGMVAAASMITGMIQGVVDTFKNNMKEIADKSIEKATEIQGKIYNNTKTITSLKTLTKSFDKLSTQVVKTTEDLAEYQDTRAQLLEILGIDEQTAQGISDATLSARALAKRNELEAKNQELLGELAKTLMGAAGNYDVGGGIGNVLGKVGMGAAAGAMATGWMASTGIGAIGTAIGTAVGAAIGLVVGLVEEIKKARDANDARGKIHEALQTDEGVSQYRTLLSMVYENQIDEAKAGGAQLAKDMKSTYNSIMSSLSGAQIENMLKDYNYDVNALSKSINKALQHVLPAVHKLNAEGTSFTERYAAAKEVYEALLSENEEAAKSFYAQYQTYLVVGAALGDAAQYVDKFKWAVADVADFLKALTETMTVEEAREVFDKLGAALSQTGDHTDALMGAVEGLGDSALLAAEKLITGGKSMQDVADDWTRASNKVKTMRETQAKWSEMSQADRQAFIDDNAAFFRNKEARAAFLEGRDITPYLAEYRKQLQDDTRKALLQQRDAANIEMKRIRENIAAGGYTDDHGNFIAWTEKDLEGFNNALQDTERQLLDIDDALKDVDHMFDLSLSEIVDKQNEQIAKMKEMYKAEEQALVDSLNKRKEAYEKYFDDLAEAETVADYVQSRDQLIENISKLSSGSDATSRNKVRELQKQLATLEKEEMQRQKEEARQAVLDNIDKQVAEIQEQFEALLSNNKELLARMNDSTKLQYLQYLQTLNLSDEDYNLRVKQLGDLLDGKWTAEGLQRHGDPNIEVGVTEPSTTTVDDREISTTTINVGSQSETVELSKAQMNEFIKSMLGWLNANAGTSFKY